MKNYGIKFTLKNGTLDYYDTLNHTDLSETETHYILDMAYIYKIPKNDVIRFDWFEVCQECRYEIYYDGCRNCYINEELK
jgi:hypothetical protein